MNKITSKKDIWKNVDIVVAHYNENLERLKSYDKNALVYHKGNNDKPYYPVKKWIKIENVGREAETYLQHIVNNYDNLADVTLFLQGGMHDQIDNRIAYKNLEKYVKEVNKYGFSTSRMMILFRKDNQIVYYGGRKESFDNGSMRHANKSFAEFYENIFGKKQPLILPMFFCANFAVSKENILKKPKSFYERLHKMVNNHVNPEEAHYFERLWFVIFNDGLNLHFLIKILLNPFKGLFYRLGKIFIK